MFFDLFSRPDLTSATASGGSGQGFDFRADNFTELTTIVAPTATPGQLAYVANSEGTWYLPGEWGGSFYSKGAYIWKDGVGWTQDRDEILLQIQTNKNHVESTSNPHLTSLVNLTDTLINAVAAHHELRYDFTLSKWKNQRGVRYTFSANLPTINDDLNNGYTVNDRWISSDDNNEYVLIDATAGAAVWKITTLQGISNDEEGNIIIENGVYYGSSVTVTLSGGVYNDLIIPGLSTKVLVRFNVTSNSTLTGVDVPDANRVQSLLGRNVGIANLTIQDLVLTSQFENRFSLGTNRTFQPRESWSWAYDNVDKKYFLSGRSN